MNSSVNMNIPHLKTGQLVRDWRALYTAATATYKPEEAIQFLPIVVDRNPADQKWATEAAKKTSLKAALDELECRLDGKKTRFVAMKEFFNLKPTASVNLENLSAFFFATLEAGKAAELTFDVIAFKFLEYVPSSTKLFDDNKGDIKGDMTEAQLIGLFDKVRNKLATLKPKEETVVKDEVFQLSAESSDGEVVMPKWAEELKNQVYALSKTVNSRNPVPIGTSTDSSMDEAYPVNNFKRKESVKKTCSICHKAGHSEKTCFKRVCQRCSGKGHDAEKCPSRAYRKGNAKMGKANKTA